jgi:hypothetical protein
MERTPSSLAIFRNRSSPIFTGSHLNSLYLNKDYVCFLYLNCENQSVGKGAFGVIFCRHVKCKIAVSNLVVAMLMF